jgi:phytoene dehydrogenase-like protein
MQINLFYHPHAFGNLQEAFNPRLNVSYAGNFLTQLFEDHGSWQSAIEHYHSNDKQRGQRYRLAVEKLRQIQNSNFTPTVPVNATSEWFSNQQKLKLELHSAKENRLQNTLRFKAQRKKENERLREAFMERKANVLKRWKKMMEKRKGKRTFPGSTTQS